MINDNIILDIPAKPDYISLVRLTTSGIAHNIGFNVEEIEDIKVCVGEACVNVINLGNTDNILIKYVVGENKLNIRVSNMIKNIEESSHSQEAELGLLIIESLMDEVEFTEKGIEMTKYIE